MKFEIKNVGRISEANIELQKLTLLLGKNDSGKTYAASTIWAIIDFINNTLKKREVKINQEISNFLNLLQKKQINEGIFSFEISAEQIKKTQKDVIDKINKNTKKILGNAIGYDGFTNSKILLNAENNNPVNLKITIEEHKESDDITEDLSDNAHPEDEDNLEKEKSWNIEYSLENQEGVIKKYQALEFEDFLVSGYIASAIKEEIIGYSCFGKEWSSLKNVVYIPAARTGIMLALDFFVQGAVFRPDRFIREEETVSEDLPAPIRRFAAQLTRRGLYQTQPDNHILSKIVRGRFQKERQKTLYSYIPDGAKNKIPLASTSSLVTELAALSLFEKRLNKSSFLIFEEPEAHLHLEAQREIAKILARLVNQGVRILLTTHSDTFIQQINNLISLSHHPRKELLLSELEISEEETINKDLVAAYEFICKETITKVKKLNIGKTGFSPESLNEVIRKLADETIKINNSWPDEEDDD